MKTDDDYLFEGSGPPEPDVARLEDLLGRYRYEPPRRRLRWILPAAAIAAGLAGLLAFLGLRPGNEDRPAWAVEWEAESGPGRLVLGEWLETSDDQTARLEVAEIGEVEVAPRSRVRIANTGPEEHRLHLARGRLAARIFAPPRLFLVETPAATAVDLGCAYTLEVDESGDGMLTVTSGHVLLEREGLPSAYVPAGAECPIDGETGPGVPRFPAGDDPALDTLRLWHLLARVGAAERPEVLDEIVRLAGDLPAGRREKLLALDPAALAALRDDLSMLW
jgi:hypothetical protein